MTSIDSENVNLSEELHTLAERYVLEATMWHEPACKEQLERSARYLAELARGAVVGRVEKSVAEAYAKAGDEILMQVQGARRFFIAVTTLPKVAKRHDKS